MLKFMKHTQKIPPERLLKQKELFDFNKACYHGFPAKPSALAWDPRLRILALATKNGEIRIFGTPGVEIYSQDDSETAITHLTFLSGQCRLVSLCEDNSLHLWQMTPQDDSSGMQLVKVNSTSLEGKLKKISVVVADSTGEHLMVGTEGGNIYLLNLATFAMSDNIIYQDVVMQNVPEDYKVNPGPVEAIAEHPTEPDKILIGYQRGLIVLWDKKNLCADQTYVCSQQLESVCWHGDGSQFTTSHNDGSYMVWSSTDSTNPSDGPHTVYGPFPCKPITKIRRPCSKSGDLIVFSGGMPRASYGDRNTVTVIRGEYHVTYNLTSKIIDFCVVAHEEAGHASCLVVLAEEEVVFIDLDTEEWPAFASPYLACLHSSAVTCSFLASNVSSDVYDKIKEAGEKQQVGLSECPWPINGGKLKNTDDPKQRDVLLTGHEDGTVQFWDASGVSLKLLYKLSTAQLFESEDLGGDGAAAEDDDWPPFRKTGQFDPYSDDPRLGVKKMEMCPYSGMLVVAGTAGQILVLNLETEEKEIVPECVNVNLVAETDNFVWKSHNKLDMRSEPVKFSAGMQPSVVVQFYPPASCTSLTLHSEWGLVACGTAHGFALFDIIQKKNILSKSTLSPLDLANAADEGPMSRRKSLKKSLRESFRRLRRGRSQRKTGKPVASPTSAGGGGATSTEEEGVKPVERSVEARSQASDYIGSMVRCLHLTKCFIANTQVMSATLWAGTNSGAIFVFTIAIPPSEKRSDVTLSVQLGKEIHLKHGAPVISICILDGASRPFPEPMAVKKEAAAPHNTTQPHRVLICSEEQFKVFTLPQLKPFCKFKLTAHEGSRVRKIGYGNFVSSADASYSEAAFMVITNQGDINVFSLPECRRQIQAPYLKKEDIAGINSVVFSNRGEALYMMSPCELERLSLSARHSTKASGTVPVLIKPKPAAEVKEKEEAPDVKANDEPAPDGDKDAPASPDASAEPAAPPAEEREAENESNKDKEEKETTEAVGGSIKKLDEVKENGDSSVLSGDITIDSIRDHMDDLKVSEKADKNADLLTESSRTVLSSSSSSTTKQESSSSVTVVKSTTITSVSSSSQESSSIQVVETASTEVNHSTVNGTE